MKKLERKKIYESDRINFYLDKVELNDKSIIENYHVINYKIEGVTVIVENKNEEILFVKAYRYLLENPEWETPGGGNEKGENIFETARREVLEESGYHIKDIQHLFSYYPSSGSTDLKFHILKADLEKEEVTGVFDTNEIADVKWIKKDKIKNMIKNNEFKDGFTLSGLMYYFLFVE